MKELNVGPVEIDLAMTVYEKVINSQIHKEEKTHKAEGGGEEENRNAPSTNIETDMKRDINEDYPQHRQSNNVTFLEELNENKVNYNKLTSDHECLQERNVASEAEIRRLLLIKKDSDLVHRKEVDALRQVIEDLTRQLANACEQVRELSEDFQGQIKDVTSHLNNNFNILLKEEKGRNKIILLRKENQISEVKKKFEKVKDEIDLSHRAEAGALRQMIDDLTGELKIALDQVQEMSLDVKMQIAATTSKLEDHFNSLLKEEKERYQDLLAEKETEICQMKKQFEKELDAVKEQMAKRFERTLSLEKEKCELDQESIQELRKSLNNERKLHQDSQDSLCKQSELVNAQAAEIVDANAKKNIMKKKLFRATREVEQLRKKSEEEANQKIVQDREALKKDQQKALDDLKLVNEHLKKEKNEEQKKHIEALAFKEAELKKVCNGLIESESVHSAELARKDEELRLLKNAHENEYKVRTAEIDEIKKNNELLKKEARQAELVHQEALVVKEADLKESKILVDKLNKEKTTNDVKLEAALKNVLHLEQRLNRREVEIRVRLHDIEKLRKKEKTDQAVLEKQTIALDKNKKDLKSKKRIIESIARERDAYKHEVRSFIVCDSKNYYDQLGCT